MTTATIPDSPAAILRQAASLIRERAEAAPAGPWAALDGGVASLADESFWPVDTTGINDDGIDRATRVHIASWSPPVALAVADWLADTATDADEFVKPGTPGWGCDCCGEYLTPGACSCWDKPLAVARAYLNGETGV
jgi:hypothetical protein